LNGPFGLAFIPRGINASEADTTNTGDGRLVITEDLANRVSIWSSSTGTLIHTFGSEGNGALQFNRPCGVAVLSPTSTEPDGLIFVADFMNNRIVVVRPNGTFVRNLGSVGQLDWPHGVAVSPDGRMVLVSETGSSRVVGINATDGKRVAILAGPSPPTELGQGAGGRLRRPSRIVVGNDVTISSVSASLHIQMDD
jgi:DNA-binding beta-propeller fold protein YncE